MGRHARPDEDDDVRHEPFQPMYSGGVDPHETNPLPRPEIRDPDPHPDEQVPWPLVSKDEPLAAEREPEAPRRKSAVSLFWVLIGLIVMSVSLALAIWAVYLIEGPRQTARCPAPPTVTVTQPAPPPEVLP